VTEPRSQADSEDAAQVRTPNVIEVVDAPPASYAAGELGAQFLWATGLLYKFEVVGRTIFSVPSGRRYVAAGICPLSTNIRTSATCTPRSRQTSLSGRKLACTYATSAGLNSVIIATR